MPELREQIEREVRNLQMGGPSSAPLGVLLLDPAIDGIVDLILEQRARGAEMIGWNPRMALGDTLFAYARELRAMKGKHA